ncbi:MAG: SufD family Fe-S cluster assembly protein [bacterium]|nr:SufD family Fe-S cluster assembly protein [bacterium]
MADTTTARGNLDLYLRETAGRCWSAGDLARALEQARQAAIPSRLEEDWRRTDPDEFPWDKLEQVDALNTVHDITLRALGSGEAAGIVPLEPRCEEHCRAMQVIAGDDYDAKFLYYHKALARDPVCFRVPKGFHGEPVELVQTAQGPGLATFSTVLVIEPGAELTLYDRWESGKNATAAIGRTEILVQEGAKLIYLQEDAAGENGSLYRRGRVQLEKDAKLEWYAATPGAAWHAARLEILLNGEGADALFKGLFAGSGAARADHRTHQFHNAARGRSDLMMKTLLAGRAHSVYQGTIAVPRQSQKTDAYQQCRNLLLSREARADAMPKLEIIADDVRCTHGASMGSLNDEPLFYLQTRGLTRWQATVAIASGFAEEIIRHVPVPTVQQRWRTLVSRTIGKAEE